MFWTQKTDNASYFDLRQITNHCRPAQMEVSEESTSNIIIKVNLGAKTPRRK